MVTSPPLKRWFRPTKPIWALQSHPAGRIGAMGFTQLQGRGGSPPPPAPPMQTNQHTSTIATNQNENVPFLSTENNWLAHLLYLVGS